MLHAGLITDDEFLNKQTGFISSVNSVEAAKYISLEEASVNTWLGGVGGTGQRFAVDYYYRGSVVGLLLDISIRHDTAGAASLDDVMRRLYRDYYKKNRGFGTADLIAVIDKITGRSYRPFFDKYISGTEPLPYDELFARVGLKLEEQKTRVAQFGVGVGPNNVIAALAPGSLAEAAGVKLGDLFLGIAGFDATDKNWRAEFRAAYADKGGQPVALRVSRDGKPLTFDLKVIIVERSNYSLKPMPEDNQAGKRLWQGWLDGKQSSRATSKL
jgi:predicted metalloprotease with PDZ domain